MPELRSEFAETQMDEQLRILSCLVSLKCTATEVPSKYIMEILYEVKSNQELALKIDLIAKAVAMVKKGDRNNQTISEIKNAIKKEIHHRNQMRRIANYSTASVASLMLIAKIIPREMRLEFAPAGMAFSAWLSHSLFPIEDWEIEQLPF